jgi:uncharacterized membrane protein YfcA
MSLQTAILLFFAGVVGGVMNALAGGGSFVAFPTLLFTGVPSVPANATNTVALWVGTAASVGAHRQRRGISRRVLVPLIVTSVLGSVSGALLLLRTPEHTFLRLVPWLMLAATLLFACGKRLTARFAGSMPHEAGSAAIAGANVFVLVVAVYGGYFGGGIGIAILAMLGGLGMTDIHAMNAIKIILVGVINGVAVVTFIAARAVFWPQALVMMAGAVLGGYCGALYSQRLPESWIRAFVLLVGASMTVFFFLRYH